MDGDALLIKACIKEFRRSLSEAFKQYAGLSAESSGNSPDTPFTLRSGLLSPYRLLRRRGRRCGSLRDQPPVNLVDGRVVLGQLTGNLGTCTIRTALGAHGQCIERARLCAGGKDANRIEKGSKGVGSRQHRSSERRGAGSLVLPMGGSSILRRHTPAAKETLLERPLPMAPRGLAARRISGVRSNSRTRPVLSVGLALPMAPMHGCGR